MCGTQRLERLKYDEIERALKNVGSAGGHEASVDCQQEYATALVECQQVAIASARRILSTRTDPSAD